MEKRKRRFTKLGKMGAKLADVVQAAAIPKVAYGARATGVPPQLLRRPRGIMQCGLPKAAGGTSSTLRFIFARKRRYDPIYAAVELPVLYWARQAFAAQESCPSCSGLG